MQNPTHAPFTPRYPGRCRGDNDDIDMSKIALAYTGLPGFSPREFVLFSENHDISSNQHAGRIPHIVDPDGTNTYWGKKKAMLLLGLALTAPGTPMLLQGQEFLTRDSFDFPVPPPLNWSLAVANAGILRQARDLVHLRGSLADLRGPQALVLSGEGHGNAAVKVCAVLRGSSTLVVTNFKRQTLAAFPVSGVPDGEWSVRFNGDSRQYAQEYGDSCAGQHNVTVSGGRATLCVPSTSMLLLTRAANHQG